MVARRKQLFTIGHSTHPIDTLVELLRQHRIVALADGRSFPSSRKWPQFNQAALSAALVESAIDYKWLKALGGRRHSPRADSPHQGWRVEAFRSYADYADTEEFRRGLGELIEIASARRTAIMCSEGLWWRCHRRIISDHLTIRGWRIEHILPDGKLVAHELPEFARVEHGRIFYDGGRPPLTPLN